MVMDILRVSEEDLYTMDMFEYNEKINYAATTYRLRCAQLPNTKGKKGKGNTETVHFFQPPGWDIDPLYKHAQTTNVGKPL
jgi:hypothetical protein